MIKAFRKQLQHLARDPKDPFTRYIHQMAGPRQAPRIEAPLRDMIVHMPAMIVQIYEWAGETNHPWKIRRAHNFVLAYLYNPEDFLSEKKEGLFGYIDDAYLVTRVYQHTLEELRFGTDPLTEIPVHADELARWIQLTREILPEVTDRIDGVLQKLDTPTPFSAHTNKERSRS